MSSPQRIEQLLREHAGEAHPYVTGIVFLNCAERFGVDPLELGCDAKKSESFSQQFFLLDTEERYLTGAVTTTPDGDAQVIIHAKKDGDYQVTYLCIPPGAELTKERIKMYNAARTNSTVKDRDHEAVQAVEAYDSLPEEVRETFFTLVIDDTPWREALEATKSIHEDTYLVC